jgi:hypothetical protein
MSEEYTAYIVYCFMLIAATTAASLVKRTFITRRMATFCVKDSELMYVEDKKRKHEGEKKCTHLFKNFALLRTLGKQVSSGNRTGGESYLMPLCYDLISLQVK